MTLSVRSFESTPNPNAIKCVLAERITPAPRSYFNAQQAKDASDTLAIALFALPGVTNILIHSEWISVNKTPGTSWDVLKPAIERVLRES